MKKQANVSPEDERENEQGFKETSENATVENGRAEEIWDCEQRWAENRKPECECLEATTLDNFFQ